MKFSKLIFAFIIFASIIGICIKACTPGGYQTGESETGGIIADMREQAKEDYDKAEESASAELAESAEEEREIEDALGFTSVCYSGFSASHLQLPGS